jgi:ComF family protein
VSLVGRVLDVAFPPKCVGCGEFGAFFCEDCLADAPYAIERRCPKCWMIWRAVYCTDCNRFPRLFTAMRSAFSYEGVAKNAVHALKFDGVSALAPAMARPMADALKQWSQTVDVVVPVPLGSVRKRTRGYNQSELLAREVSRLNGLPIETGALRRVRQTPAQAQQPGEEARQRNVEAAFGPGKRPVSGSVLLIDDVATTGATLSACAGVLLSGGAEAVYGLTFARED